MTEMADLLLVNGTLVTPDQTWKGCVGIKDGKILCLLNEGASIPAKKVIDVEGNYVLPGAMDPHVHFQDPGFTQREDFAHGTMAAAAGGITTVLSHPLDHPPTTSFAALKKKEEAYEGNAYVDYGIHIGATRENIGEIERLWKETGATAIKMFMCFSVKEFPYVEKTQLRRILELIGKMGGLAIIHAEDNAIIENMERNVKASGAKDGRAYNQTHPKEAEIAAIREVLDLLKETKAKAVILHVSTAEGLRLIHQARKQGIQVYAESAPHLFQFTEEDMDEKGPYLKFSPVMHDRKNQKEMWDLLGKGYVDSIGSDHSPYTKAEKDAGLDDIWKAPNGIPGIETSLAVFLNGVNEGRLTLNQLAAMTSRNPARIYGLEPEKGNMVPGADADFTIVDMNLEKCISPNELKSKCKWSPYTDVKLKGWPVMTIVRGRLVYDHGNIVGEKGYGRYIKRKK